MITVSIGVSVRCSSVGRYHGTTVVQRQFIFMVPLPLRSRYFLVVLLQCEDFETRSVSMVFYPLPQCQCSWQSFWSLFPENP